MKRFVNATASAAVLAAGLGLVGLGQATTAQAAPGPMLDYHWCPGQFFDPAWGFNWDGNRCHDDSYYDGERRDRDHWHGQGPWHP